MGTNIYHWKHILALLSGVVGTRKYVYKTPDALMLTICRVKHLLPTLLIHDLSFLGSNSPCSPDNSWLWKVEMNAVLSFSTLAMYA
jgi:hypothetical protein